MGHKKKHIIHIRAAMSKCLLRMTTAGTNMTEA